MATAKKDRNLNYRKEIENLAKLAKKNKVLIPVLPDTPDKFEPKEFGIYTDKRKTTITTKTTTHSLHH